MGLRYIGNVISATPPDVTINGASGVWTLNQQAAYQSSQLWPPLRDPYFNQTVLLLHGNGNPPNGLIELTYPKELAFVDNSTNNFQLAPTGSVRSDSASPFETPDGYWSVNFNGTSDYLRADTALDAINTTTHPFTISFWVYPRSAFTSVGNMIPIGINRDSDGYNLFLWRGVDIYYNEGSQVACSKVPIVNYWNYVELIYDGSTLTAYLNGESVGSNSSVTFVTAFSSCVFGIGAEFDAASGGIPGNYFNGYLSNLKVVDAALSPSALPTAPSSDESGTTFLSLQSNRFVDNSSSPKAITVYSGPEVVPFNPFTTDYNTVDGSGYFDGSASFLSAPNNAAFGYGTGAFTVEAWIYRTSTTADVIITGLASGENNRFALYIGPTNKAHVRETGVADLIVSSADIPVNAWTHIATARSGTTLSLWINGSRSAGGTVTNSTNFLDATLQIGANSTGTNPVNGYLSNVRIVKGTAVYDPTSTTITIPTASLPEVSGTSILTCQYQGAIDNNGFIDSSVNNFPITRSGNTTQGTFSPFSTQAGGWSNYFDGTGDYLSIANNSALDVTQGSFTIEAFVYRLVSAEQQNIIVQRPVSGSSGYGFRSDTTTNNLVFYYTGGLSMTSSSAVPANQWSHVVAVRDGSNAALFINGVRVANTAAASNGTTSTETIRIAIDQTLGNDRAWDGYISNLRVVKGTAVYDPTSTTLTVPTAPLTAVSGTSLLTCQSNRFVDNSTNNFAITRNGDVEVTPFSPYAPTAAYSASVNGGSGYFDGSGDYLTLTDTNNDLDLGGVQASVDFWAYLPNTTTQYASISKGNANSYSLTDGIEYALLRTTSNTWILYYNNGGTAASISGASSSANEWVHVCVATDTSNNIALFVNGTRLATAVNAISKPTTRTNIKIGEAISGTSDWSGYMSGLRFLTGANAYDPTDTTITIPTAPPTAVSGTELLCNFTNAGIFDNTSKNAIQTVGNSRVSTTEFEYGGGSMKFDGTGDYIDIPFNQDFVFGTGDFTVELWVYVNSTGRFPMVMLGTGVDASPLAESTWALRTNTTDLIFSRYDDPTSTTFSVTWSAAATTWYHIAVTRSGTDLRFFVDGTQVGATQTSSTDFSAVSTTDPLRIGRFQYAGGTLDQLNGFIDDLRITKGVARYTENFTPPTKQFLDL